MLLVMPLILSFTGCKVPKEESIAISNDKVHTTYVTPPLCYNIHSNRYTTNELDLKKGFFGNIAIRAEIDTSNLRLTKLSIIKTFLKKEKDSSAYAEYINTDYKKEPTYPVELLEILPLINQYFDTVKVIKYRSTTQCELVNAFTLFVKIK